MVRGLLARAAARRPDAADTAVRRGVATPGTGDAGWLPEPGAGEFLTRRYVGKHGSRSYKLYVPPGYGRSGPVPLIVMLHGCTQDADDIARGTRLNALAAAETFLVAYPEQPRKAQGNKCWRWYDPKHQERDQGEPAIIAGITREVMATYRVDARRVFIAGMSAGGAMAVTAAVAYPELYAAIGVHSGLAYRPARNAHEAVAVMRLGAPEQATRGGLVVQAMGERARVLPAIIFHGGADAVVSPTNVHQLGTQLVAVHDLLDGGEAEGPLASPSAGEARGSAGGYGYTRSVYRDGGGTMVLEKWLIDELGHAWSGGSPDGSFTDPSGPDATRELVRFFLELPLGTPSEAAPPEPLPIAPEPSAASGWRARVARLRRAWRGAGGLARAAVDRVATWLHVR